jgi:HEPN domain-containing protein
MKPPEDVARDLAQQWIRKAELDYRAAESLLRDTDPIHEVIAFHCQQAAEKYLKALLVSVPIEFPRTHDLDQLLELLAPVMPEVAVTLGGIGALSPFGVGIRYPGDFPELLAGQETALFDLARLTRDTVMARLEL